MTNTLPASQTSEPCGASDAPALAAAPVTASGKARRAKPATATGISPYKSETAKSPPTKTEALLKKLKSAKGVTVEALMEATGWQAHSVRGFLSGTVKKKLGLTVISEVGKDEIRRYRIVDQKQAD